MYPNQVVVLDRGDYTVCTVNLHGLTITSWRIDNEEQIFLSRRSKLSYLGRIRGGLGVAFPQYGKWDFGKQHGFARDLMWSLERGPELTAKGDVFADFSLKSDAYTESLWNFRFLILYRITLHERKLEIQISLENTSEYLAFEFNFMQHCLLKVADVSKCKISGFQNCRYLDRLDPDRGYCHEEREEITIAKQTDVVYERVPNVVYLDGSGNGERVLKIEKTGLPDMTIWNPWVEQSKNLVDLDEDEYKYFIAAEAGILTEKLYMYPSSNWQASVIYEIIEPKKNQIVMGDFYDYFKGYC